MGWWDDWTVDSGTAQFQYQMETDYHKNCKKASRPDSASKKTAFLEVQSPSYVRSYYKQDRAATILLHSGHSSQSYSHHINPNFRLPKHKP